VVAFPCDRGIAILRIGQAVMIQDPSGISELDKQFVVMTLGTFWRHSIRDWLQRNQPEIGASHMMFLTDNLHRLRLSVVTWHISLTESRRFAKTLAADKRPRAAHTHDFWRHRLGRGYIAGRQPILIRTKSLSSHKWQTQNSNRSTIGQMTQGYGLTTFVVIDSKGISSSTWITKSVLQLNS